MNTGNRTRQISHWLNVLSDDAKTLSALNRNDRAIDAERVFGRVLSIVFDCNLINLNHEHSNHPSVDFGDQHAKIAVQVTINTSAQKIHDTLDSFFSNRLDTVYSKRLIIMVVAQKVDYRAHFRIPTDFPFNPETDILDIRKLMKLIDTLDEKRILEIHNYLRSEMEPPAEEPRVNQTKKTEPKRLVVEIVGEIEYPLHKFTHSPAPKPKPQSIPTPKQNTALKHESVQPILVTGYIFCAGVLMLLFLFWLGSRLFVTPSQPHSPNPLGEYSAELRNKSNLDSTHTMYFPVVSTLRESDLVETSTPVFDYNQTLNQLDNLETFYTSSVSFPFAAKCTQLKANPISAFIALVNNDLFKKTGVQADSFSVQLDNKKYISKYQTKLSRFHAKSHQTDNYNADAFLEDIISMSQLADDGLDLEAQFLNTVYSGSYPITDYSWDDFCYYTYYVYYGDYSAHILCLYLRTGDDQEQLTDVEFQMLNLIYCAGKPVGGTKNMQRIHNSNQAQATSLIMAIENLLVGETVYQTRASYAETDDGRFDVQIPATYSLRDYQVSIEQKFYESDALGVDESGNCIEQGYLITYRIQK